MKVLSELQLRVFEKAEIECLDTRSLLGDLLDNDLPQCLLSRVQLHIDSCEQCQEQERSYREVIELAASLRNKPIPDGVQSRLREALSKRLGVSLQGNLR